MRLPRALLSGVGAVVALLGACAPPGPPAAVPATAAPGQPTGAAESLDALYSAAKQEGQLALYGTLNTQFAQPLIDKFGQLRNTTMTVTGGSIAMLPVRIRLSAVLTPAN